MNPYQFKGGLHDRTTNWVKFGHRWYSVEWGRFSQQDTLDAPLDPANANRYAFAANDPINNSDPLGLYSWEEFWGSTAGEVTKGVVGLLGIAAKRTLPGAIIGGIAGCVGGIWGESVVNPNAATRDYAGACGGGAVNGVIGFSFGKVGIAMEKAKKRM